MRCWRNYKARRLLATLLIVLAVMIILVCMPLWVWLMLISGSLITFAIYLLGCR